MAYPITADEATTAASAHYGIEVRTVISLVDEGINLDSLLADGSVAWPRVAFPSGGRGVMALKPMLSRILGVGKDPFLSATITADLDQPVISADIQMDLGVGNLSLSPYVAGPAWDWYGFLGGATGQVFRPLFDPGVYIQLQGRLISQTPRVVSPDSPTFVDRGTLVQTAGAGIGVSPAWPPHAVGHVALLFVVTANEVATVSVPAGFVEIPGSPQGTGTAGAAGSVRLAIYWCRATSNAMPSPTILNPGNHVIARILTWQGVVESGSPFDVNPVGNVAASASVTVNYPALTIANQHTKLIKVVAGATDTTADQTLLPPSLPSPGGLVFSFTGRTDSWRDIGNGGGFAVYDLGWNIQGAIGGGTSTLRTATAQAFYSIALKAPAARIVVDDPNLVPWRPFFTGRIDSADPTGDDSTILRLRCRDLYADLLDQEIVPPPGQTGFLMTNDSSDGSFGIDELLTQLAATRSPVAPGLFFQTIGSPDMIVPEYFQEGGVKVLLAMRTAGLQNGWDLRGRYGTSPYGERQYVLTYYEPDRALAGRKQFLGVDRYLDIPTLGVSRDEVRNWWRVTPADPPRDTVELFDTESEARYGVHFASIIYGTRDLVRTSAQASALIASLMADTAQPKVIGEVSRRFYPWVEVNDVYTIGGNGVTHVSNLDVAVSGYTHTITADGDGTTLLRCRSKPAAASREWRALSQFSKQIVSPDPPVGSAPEGTRWLQRRDS